MPLQIRRGPTADRLAITPLVGEIVYDTTTGAVYVGNGVTAGGVPVTSFSVADSKNATVELFLGLSHSDNTQHSGITFQNIGGRIQATVAQDLSNFQGLISADQGFKGNLWADDSGLIVNSETHTVYGNFVAEGTVLPSTTESIDIGSPYSRFKDAYFNSLYLGNANIVSTGTAVDLPVGSTIGGQPAGLNEGDTYNISISGNVISSDSTTMVNTATGTFRGDLVGSVFADDSSILVDGTEGVLRGTLVGNVTGNVTGNLIGTANLAAVATTVALTPTNTSIDSHYLAFTLNSSGNEGLRTDNGLSYVPSTNTLAAGIFQGNFSGILTGNLAATDTTVLINATTKQIGYAGANLTGDFTGNVFTNLIDSADSSAITVTPATIFSSDVTFENELLSGNIFPSTSETFNLGSYTKKFDKLYLTEQANALWIGNAVIGGSGSTINLPLGSTVGGSPITTTAGTNAVTVTVNTTGTNADYYLGFVDQQSGDRQFYTDDTLKYNPSTGNMTLPVVTASLVGNVTGNVTGNLSATDATILINGTSKEIGYTGAILKGNLTGNVTGNLSGDVTGTAAGSSFVSANFSTTFYSSTLDHVGFIQAHSTVDTRNIGFRRARGTIAAPTTVLAGDKIADLAFFGHNGAAYVEGVRLSVESDQPSTGKATFKIFNNTGGSFVENFSVDGDGFVNINARLQVAGVSISQNNISTISSNDDIVLDPNGTGTVDFMVPSQTTVGPSGAASTLPAAPTKYIKIKLDGVEYVIPAYLAA